MPRADMLPSFTTEISEVPSTSNPLGLRGGGEGGMTPGAGRVGNAVVDALADLGVEHVELPATPERVWNAIQAARGRLDELGRAWDKLAAPQCREVQRSSGRHPEGDGSMANLKNIDAAFTQAVESKTMPGIVAIAANDKGVIYEGAFGKRGSARTRPMTLDTVVWIASMTKAITGRRRDAARRAGQAQPRRSPPARWCASWRRRRCSRASTRRASRSCGRPSGRSRCATC